MVIILSKLFLAFFVCALDYKLILKLLSSSSNGCNGVFVDEGRIAFGRKGSDEVELALRDIYDDFLGRVAEQILGDCSGLVVNERKTG